MTGREQKKENNVLCYQIRQPFYPGEITPKEANRIGYELAMRWTCLLYTSGRAAGYRQGTGAGGLRREGREQKGQVPESTGTSVICFPAFSFFINS